VILENHADLAAHVGDLHSHLQLYR
jgi:hypothetical protein